ncbi:hypothetical protein [Sneathiella sp.]|uniref:hypothetical protein n=1 Tax=Sneathiella sp. TaxID=1964365 RepID=UPI003567CB33
MIAVKDKSCEIFNSGLALIQASSWTMRLIFALPVIAAAVFSALAVTLDILFREAETHSFIPGFLEIFIRLFVFLVPLTWLGYRLVIQLQRSGGEKRLIDALWVGLCLPQAVITGFLIYTQLAGSLTIASLSSAIALWAMLSLFFTPFSLIFVLIAWSFMPARLSVPAFLPTGGSERDLAPADLADGAPQTPGPDHRAAKLGA